MMSDREKGKLNKLDARLKATFMELRQFEEYVDGYLKETAFQIFTVKETQAALIEHLGCDAAVIEIIKKRQAEAEKERERIKLELEEKQREREAQAEKIHEGIEATEPN